MTRGGGSPDIVEDARSGKRLLNGFVVLAAAIFLTFTVLIGLLLPQLAFTYLKGALPEARLWFFVISGQLYAYAYMAALVFAVVRFVEGRKIRTLGFRRTRWFRELLAGLGTGAGMAGAVVLALAAAGCVTVESPPSQPTGFAAAGPLLILFPGFVVQGGTEEVVSRGWILTSVSARHNRIWGVAPMACVNLALFGVFTSLITLRANSLWGACGFHAAWNFALGNLFGLDVSGIPLLLGTALDLKTRGSALLTDGAFGPEAGLPVSAALALGIAWLLVTRKITPPRAAASR